MGRNLYFIVILFMFSSSSWGWLSYRSKVGAGTPFPYQSSNPTVELKTTRNINQAESAECYLFAFAGALEVANKNGWNRPDSPKLSTEYLFIEKLYSWAQNSLTNETKLDDTFYFLVGGDVHHAMRLTLENGLIPQEFFKPKVPYNEWDFKLLYKDVRDIVKEGRGLLSATKSVDLKPEILRIILDRVKSRIEQNGGKLPEQFVWSGRSWTTKTFENAYGIKRNSHVYMLYPQGYAWDMESPWDLRKALMDMVEVFKGAFNYRQASWNKIWQYVLSSVDQGLPAILSLKWSGSFHVMNVVGYEYNNRSEIVSFKLKNSWDEEFGDKGHAFFGPLDLQKNITSVWGFKAP